jgi:glucose-6-phosphate 1-dehydrogenase
VACRGAAVSLAYSALDGRRFGRLFARDPFLQKLAVASLLRSDSGWRRVILEKPFGHDKASARALDRECLRVIDEAH